MAIPGICKGAKKSSTASALIFVRYTLDRIQCFWSIFRSWLEKAAESNQRVSLLIQYLGKGFDAPQLH